MLATMKNALLLCACFGFSGCASQPIKVACPESSLPMRWLHAIEMEDWDTMGSLLHADAVYDDPTMAYFGDGPIHLMGRDSIVEFWRQSDEESGSRYMEYEVPFCFESADLFVINAVIHLEVGGAYWKVAREYLPLTSAQTTILNTKDGKITHVVDYVDYGSAIRQIEALRVQYGETPNAQGSLGEGD